MSNSIIFKSRSKPEKLSTEVVFITQSEEKKPEAPPSRYQEALKKLTDTGAFDASKKSIRFLRFGGRDGAENVLFAGLGVASELKAEDIRRTAALIHSTLKAEKTSAAFLSTEDLPTGNPLLNDKDFVSLLTEGLALCGYEFKKHKTKNKESEEEKAKESEWKEFSFLGKGFEGDEIFSYADALREATTVTRDWSNEPSNIGTPEFFANEAKRLGESLGLKVRVIDGKEAKKENMNLFLAVSQGSRQDPKMVVLEYNPEEKGKTVCLVGKGVTFDSGGISIKPSPRMEEMKHDMTGAATVMGATILAAKCKIPHRLISVMAFTENMPGGNAIQPGNVVKGRNGKSVEILNTDAEGRLVLADALDLAQDYEPDYMIDLATLTGAVLVALGKYACAVLGNDEELNSTLSKIGEEKGERVYPLPIYDEAVEDMKSDIADLKNISNTSRAGTILGAAFLKQFIRPKVKWAHMDIAATGWSLSHIPYFPKTGASGAHVRTLVEFLRTLK